MLKTKIAIAKERHRRPRETQAVFSWIASDLRASARAAAGWRLVVLVAISAVLILASYQFLPGYTVDVGSAGDGPFVQDFHAREISAGQNYRWTYDRSMLLLPEVSYPYQLTLYLNGWRPNGQGPRTQLVLNGEPLAQFLAGTDFQTYTFTSQSWGVRRRPAVLEIKADTFRPAGDARDLGVRLDWVQVKPVPAWGLLVVPPPLHLLFLVCAVALLFLAGERLGLGRNLPLLFVFVPATVAVLVQYAPLSVIPLYQPIFLAALLGYCFVLLVRAEAFRFLAVIYAGFLLWGVGASSPPDLSFSFAVLLAIWLLTRPSSGRRDLALVVVLSTFAIGPLLYPGVLANSDQPTHLFWLSELDKLFGQGVFYSRWAPDQAYGWGGPAFNYYSPLAWYVAEAFHLAGMGLVEAMKATLAIGIIAGMTGMYLFARTLVGKSGAIVSAIIFGYFPYLVADISIRGELAESLAICLIPATLWSFHKLVAEKKSVFAAPAALLSGLLLLGHNVTALFAFPFLVAYLGFMILKGSPANGRGRALRTSLQQCGYGILGLGLGAGISAFYWLPAIMERGLIWGGLPPRGKANPWGFQAYYMPGEWIYSLHIGDLYAGNGHHHPTGIYFLVGSVAALALIAAFRRGWLRTAFPFFTLLFPALVFLQTEGSAPFWESVPLVAFIQYPWRLLDLVGICLAVIIGGAFSLLANRLEKLSAGWQRRLGVAMAVGVTCLIVISTSMLPLQPQWDTREIDHDDREHNLAAAADMRLKGQFLPISVQPSSPQPKPQGQPELSAKGGLTTLSSTANGFDNKAWLIGLQKQSQVVFDVLYFPGWQVYVDDQRVPTTAQKQTGQVSAPVPAGKHRVELRFEDTPLRRWSDYLSAFSLVPLAVLLVVPVRRRFRLARGRARARTTVAAGGLPDFSE